MKQTLIRYKTKPESTADNERLIKDVFAQLHAQSPDGVGYLALKLGDGSFVHFVRVDPTGKNESITGLEAFGRFQSGIRDRVLEPPQSNEVMVVGNYRMLNER